MAILLLYLSVFFAASAGAEPVTSADLIEMDFEELVNLDVEIESAGKSATRALDLAYAGYVLTASEIRSSGVQTIPDALRLVPGLNVGQISAAEWSVGIRGSGGRFSRFVLVMVDGRIAYNSVFSGVNWDELNLNLEQIARIEVIRGPNASVWGANAVNGIIHIITQRPNQDQKHVASVVAGGQGHAGVSGSWSTPLGRQWRMGMSANASQWDGLVDQSAAEWEGEHKNYRVLLSALREAEQAQSYFTADGYAMEQSPRWNWVDPNQLQLRSATNLEEKHGFVLQGTHTQYWTERNYWKIRGSAEQTDRDSFLYRWDSANYQLDLELGIAIGRHKITTGVNTRYNDSTVDLNDAFGAQFRPQTRAVNTYGVFFSDTIELSRLWSLTLGLRVDDSELGGTDVQPSIRSIWHLSDTDRFWVGLSEAASTPSRSLTDMADIPYLLIPATDTNPATVILLNGYQSEQDQTRLSAIELGYRKTFGDYSIDLALFRYNYVDEINVQPLGSPQLGMTSSNQPVVYQRVAFENSSEFSSQGGELVFRGQPRDAWSTQLVLSYVNNVDAENVDSASAVYSNTVEFADGLQWYFAFRYSRGTTETATRYVDHALVYGAVDDYLVVDSNLRWSIGPHWQLDMIANNLGKKHTEALREEFSAPILLVEPNVLLKLNYRF